MKDKNALAVANYLLKIAKEKGEQLQLLKLMKLVYIAHGFGLAMLENNTSMIDPRFDKVEAWKYGPVIPSVYHSFKYFRDNPITEPAILLLPAENAESSNAYTPIVKDEEMQLICKIAYEAYGEFTGFELMELLHEKGTPWHAYYKQGQNEEIPDSATYKYYKALVQSLLETYKIQ